MGGGAIFSAVEPLGDLDDTRRHQLNMFRISEQFAGREREEGRWEYHPIYQVLAGRIEYV